MVFVKEEKYLFGVCFILVGYLAWRSSNGRASFKQKRDKTHLKYKMWYMRV